MLHLTPAERDRLLLATAADLARRRRSKGLLLNVPEATALIADEVCEAARAGARHAEAISVGRRVLTPDEVLPEVPYIVSSISVEAVFDDGSRLVVVHEPFGRLPHRDDMPGSISRSVPPASVEARDLVRVEVTNMSAVPISVTSHFHFFEANPRLLFPRAAAYGRHLDLPSGAHTRFEPGKPTSVDLVPVAGSRIVIGFSGLVDGPLDAPGMFDAAMNRVHAWGFLDTDHAGPADPERAVGRSVAAQHEAPP